MKHSFVKLFLPIFTLLALIVSATPTRALNISVRPAAASAANAGLLWPDGIEPGDASVSEAPAGKRSWWVDSAAPAGGDGSYATPFNSFEVLENSVSGGDFIYVRGTFDMATNSPTHQMTLNLYRAQASGTATAPTTLKSWRGFPRAVFNSQRSDAQLRASNNGGIRFQNIEITNFYDQGIVIGDGVLFADMVNLVVHDGQVTSGSGVGGGLVMLAQDSLHKFTLRNSLFYETTQLDPGNNSGAFTVISEPTALAGSTVTVRDNYFHDNYVAIRHKHAGRVHMNIYNNRIETSNFGLYLRMWTSDVHHNLFVRNHVGMKLESDGMNANHNYKVHHNTFYDTDWLVAAQPDQGGFVANMHIERNIFMDPSGGDGVILLGPEDWNWGTNDLSGWTMANNVFYFTPATRNFIFSAPPRESLRKNFADSKLQLGDTTSIYADPLFVNAAAGDFTLQPNSPAVGRGFDAYSVTLTSLAARDGRLLESTETSGVGGTFNSTAITISQGDYTGNRQFRSIVSFSSASLPDNAVISAVTLKLKQQVIVGGSNPFTIFQGLMLDVKSGFFGAFAALQPDDFQAPASATYGPANPALVSGVYSINLTNAKAHINKLATNGGLTQIRLRFKLDDNNDALANYLNVFSGDAPNAADHPQLVITYTVP